MNEKEFEDLLSLLCNIITDQARKDIKPFLNSEYFENRVRQVIQKIGEKNGLVVNFDPHPYIFPDIVLGTYGIEVKHTLKDTWRSVANSVFESTRDKTVKYIYLVFGKMGGKPEVKWAKYSNSVIHVRTSHVPRFEVEIGSKISLFEKMGVTYDIFSELPFHERMKYIRSYARSRLKEGERLWWLEDEPEKDHSLPIQVRLYMSLEQSEKRQLRAEAALLCPQIVKPSRSKNKYDDAAIYLLTYHGVLCSQARDLFSAGSVALRQDSERGGIYILRSLLDIEKEMIAAAANLEDALFIEYWGISCKPKKRISKWLELADTFAKDWVPSKYLFKKQ